jgi:hypothetical protein
MACAVLNLWMKPGRSARYRRQLENFLRDNRWPVEKVEVEYWTNGGVHAQKWEVNEYPPGLADEILEFIKMNGENIKARVEISEGLE